MIELDFQCRSAVLTRVVANRNATYRAFADVYYPPRNGPNANH